MTGLTPAAFHRLDRADDWRVTSRGAEAVFRARSLAHAAELVPLAVAMASEAELSVDIDLRPEAVVLRIGFVDDRLPPRIGHYVAVVTAAARSAGLHPDPSAVQAIDVYVAQPADADTRPFWAAVLGYDEKGETDAVDPLRRGPGIAVNPIRDGKRGRGRTHLDVHVSADVARARVEAALAAGGRLVDDSHAPMWWTLASPENHGVDLAAWLDTWEG